MSSSFSDTDLFLVAILPKPRDLEIARMLGWYRIPLKSAPKVIEADYLAFYQTSTFGEGHRWKVEYAAQVRGHELTTRMELFKDEKDHPRNKEEYFKISLGPVFPLPVAIPAGSWKRMTFLYTIGEKIRTARSLNELVTHDRERDILWHALRERATKAEEYHAEEFLPEDLDPVILALLAGLELEDLQGDQPSK